MITCPGARQAGWRLLGFNDAAHCLKCAGQEPQELGCCDVLVGMGIPRERFSSRRKKLKSGQNAGERRGRRGGKTWDAQVGLSTTIGGAGKG